MPLSCFFFVCVPLLFAPLVSMAFAFRRRMQIGFKVKDPDEIVIGNWRDERFLEGQVFDTVLADYLVGAIDGFAPYFQVIFHKWEGWEGCGFTAHVKTRLGVHSRCRNKTLGI